MGCLPSSPLWQRSASAEERLRAAVEIKSSQSAEAESVVLMNRLLLRFAVVVAFSFIVGLGVPGGLAWWGGVFYTSGVRSKL